MQKKQQLSPDLALKKATMGAECLFISKVCPPGLEAQGLADQE